MVSSVLWGSTGQCPWPYIIYSLHEWLPEVVKSNLWEFVDYLLLYIVNDWLDISTDWLKWLYGLLGNHQWILTNANIWLLVEIQIDNIQCSSDNSIIQQCTKEFDLGVIFTADLKFSCHMYIYSPISKVSKMIGTIYCKFHVLTPYALCLLYTSLVMSHLVYACVVWQPYLLKDIRALEAVQRRTTS